MAEMKKIFFILLFIIVSTQLHCQINTEALRRTFKHDTLTHSVNAEIGLAKGNSEYIGILTGYRGDLYTGKFYTFLSLNLEYREASSKKLINKGFAHLRSMYEYLSFLSFEVFLQQEYNEFILLKDRKLLGGGGRFSFLDSNWLGKFDINLGLGLMVEKESFKTDIPTINNNIRTTNYVSLKWEISNMINLMDVIYYQAELDNFSDYKILNETNLNIKISNNLSFYTSLKYRFDNKPVKDIKNYDLSLTNGIKIAF